MTDSDFLKALKSASELEITFVGRKSGKKFSAPVWFVQAGEKLYLLPVKGTASQWYRSVVKNPMVEVQTSGRKVNARARPMKEGREVEEALERFREKYGASDVKRYYPRQDVALELSI